MFMKLKSSVWKLEGVEWCTA